MSYKWDIQFIRPDGFTGVEIFEAKFIKDACDLAYIKFGADIEIISAINNDKSGKG